MGGNQSFPLPRYSCCIRPESPDRCRENHARLSRSSSSGSMKGKRKSRSSHDLMPQLTTDASCVGFGEDAATYGLLDINAATAEELMTLPAINRATATNIVDYRRKIGGFRKIEDLALVPGVGATRFGHLRAEICVTSGGSFAARSSLIRSGSSATSSGIDVSVTPADNVSRDYSGVGHLLGGRDSDSASVSCDFPPTATIGSDMNENLIGKTGRSIFVDTLDDATVGMLHRSMRKRVPVKTRVGSGVEDSVTGPLRVATWDIKPCTPEKAENAGVREVFSLTLIENRIGIVAVQGVTDVSVLQKFCNELNYPTVPSVKEWISEHRDNWRYVASPSSASDGRFYAGLLYDVSRGTELLTTASVATDLFVCDFKTSCGERLSVVTWLGGYDTAVSQATLDFVAQLLQDSKAIVLLLGNFGGPCETPELAWLCKLNLSAALRSDQFTDISTSNMTGSQCSENIWTSQLASSRFGTASVIRDGLTSPWIPDGWSWGGLISSQCPVWIEYRSN